MRIGILHLSDLHFREANNSIVGRQESILGAVRSLGSFDALFVALSGDIAFSGKEGEYSKALDFFSALQQLLKSLPQTRRVEYIAVPGNHDCNFDNIPQTRDPLIDALSAGKIAKLEDNSILNTLTSIQDNFFIFLGALVGGEYSGTRRLGYQHRFNVEGYSVMFNCFNTAWMSQKDEKQGRLVLPVEKILEGGLDLKPSDVSCAIFHHPYSWLEAENGKRFRKWIDDNCHLILTGHEHEVDQVTQRRISGAETDYLEGGILQSDKGNESAFNVQAVDFADKTTLCYQFTWDGAKYVMVKQSQSRSLHHKAATGVFENDSKYEDYLNDLDAGFTHPVRGQLRLEDIFVYPDLRVLDPELMATGMPYMTVSGEKLLDYVSSQMKVVVGGSDTGGKTLLLKKLYKDLKGQGYVPLLIIGSQVPSDRGKIGKFLDESVVTQYSANKIEEYKQLDKAKKVILIDDLHKLSMGYKERCRLVVQLMDIADRIVVTTDNLISLDELVAEGKNPFPSFKHCVLPDLGYEVRGRLIEKWVALSENQYHDPAESVYKIKVLENSLDSLIRNRLLASNPFTVLTALQILDGNVPSMNTVSGSYGYLYEFLITGAFGRTSKEAIDLDIKYNFLSECANFMHDRAITQVSEEQISQIVSQFRQDYLVTVNEEALLRELVESRVLRFQDGSYFFCYPYIYHYFVARHMRSIIRDPQKNKEAQQKLDFMINNLHRDDCTNIVILLCYLSPDSTIIEGILNKAKSIFSGHKPCQLMDEVAFLDKYIAKEPEISVVESDPQQIRQLGRKAKDAVEPKGPFRPAIEVSDEQRDAALFEVRVAFKTMQVMGQILRNFPGSLRGSLKLSLANESYQLGLRLLSAALADFGRDAEGLRAMYMEHLHDQYPKQSPKATIGLASAFVFIFAEMCARSVIKAISYSVGSGRLAPVYQNILDQNNSLPIQIIDITIRLDHFKTIPNVQIASTYDLIKHRALPATMLKLIVIDSLMKYPPSRSKRQSVLSKLGIRLSPRLLLEAPKSRVFRP